MSFGQAWTELMGNMTKEQAFSILDYYYEQGVCFAALEYFVFIDLIRAILLTLRIFTKVLLHLITFA